MLKANDIEDIQLESSTDLPVRILCDILFTPAFLHCLILSPSICLTPPSMVFRKSSFAFSIGVSDLINVRRVLGEITWDSITLSTTISAPDILDKYAAWLRALSYISEPSCGINIF